MSASTELAVVPTKETALQVYSAPNGLDPYTLHHMINFNRELFCSNRANNAAASATTDVDEPVSLQFCNDFNYLDHL